MGNSGAGSAAALWRAADAYDEAIDLGAGPLLAAVESDALLAERLRTLSRQLAERVPLLPASGPGVEAADGAWRKLLHDAIAARAPWATAFLLCNHRWFVHQWTVPETAANAARVSPFVYQMQ